MKPVGTHVILDAWEAPANLLNDPAYIRQALQEAAQAGNTTLIDICVHHFSPNGVTATATLAESHIAIHTWPEFGYFAADLFFCGGGDPYQALQSLQKAFQAKHIQIEEIKRGIKGEKQKMKDFIGQCSANPVL